uniref:Photosystem I assembly protein ycf20 n=1 Tax=Ulva intestinalis TaxID=3116 RepID=A0A8F4XLG7_ULVIN|nr:photosystem I assembly protein ycf20 [Ulva intestinalis]
MFYNTKFLKLLNSFYFNVLNKFKFIEKYFVVYIFLLLLGFVCGNLFGTFLIFFRVYTNWDGLIIILTILFIEFINFITYIKSFKYHKFNKFFVKIYKNKIFFLLFKNLKFLNFYKMGLLLGFFIDAFKVGS